MTPPPLEGERISIGRSRFTIPHRPLATRFGLDSGVSILSFRSLAVWMLGYPEAGLSDADHALKDAREIGQAATLMYALFLTSMTCLALRRRSDDEGGDN
jgi:hypothetical protein